jgi:SAM-dependent methyltransferase
MDVFKKLSMEEVLKKQKEQHSNVSKKGLTVKRRNIRVKDIALLRKLFPNAKSVLCVGSREDSEVKDFIDAGFTAVGTDILDETKLIRKIDAHDLNNHFSENEFDIVFASHSLEHVLDVKKVMKNIKYIAKEGVFIVLPITPGHAPKWKHPTVFEIMKLDIKKETANIFMKPSKYAAIWSDFDSLKPFELLEGNFRKGLTEPREVYICLKF